MRSCVSRSLPSFRCLSLIFVAAASLCFGACGDDDAYYGLGAYCRGDADCPLGARCEHKLSGVGECLYECEDDRYCPQPWACVDAHGGSCHLLCRNNLDCPLPLECKKKKAKGGGGDYLVCD